MFSRHDSFYYLLAFVFIAAGFVAHALYFNFLNDDAFISFRYSDNLIRHGELVFNPGERVEGYTNFLWTVAMAGVIGLGLDPATWSRIISVALGILTLFLAMSFMSKVRQKSTIGNVLPAALLAASPSYACWATGGLETQLFTTLSTLALIDYTRGSLGDSKALLRSGFWFSLASMTRPEGMLLLGLVALYHMGTMVLERRIRPSGLELKWAAVFLVFFVPFFAWRWSYYGWPFPNTYYVKTGATGFWRPGFRYLLSWVNTNGLWFLPPLAYIGWRTGNEMYRRFIGVGIIVLLGLGFHVVRVGGDFMALHRFLVPIIPLVAIMATVGLIAIFNRLWAFKPTVCALIIVGICVISALHISKIDQHAMSNGSDQGVDRIGWLKSFHQQCTAIGQWLADHAEPNMAIATTAAGIIPYYSKLYTVDILGLNDEWVAHNVPARGQRPGHTKSAPLSYILKKDVDYLIYHPTISDRRPRRSAAEKAAWAKRGYTWKTIQVEGLDPPWWGVWVRDRKP